MENGYSGLELVLNLLLSLFWEMVAQQKNSNPLKAFDKGGPNDIVFVSDCGLRFIWVSKSSNKKNFVFQNKSWK